MDSALFSTISIVLTGLIGLVYNVESETGRDSRKQLVKCFYTSDVLNSSAILGWQGKGMEPESQIVSNLLSLMDTFDVERV